MIKDAIIIAENCDNYLVESIKIQIEGQQLYSQIDTISMESFEKSLLSNVSELNNKVLFFISIGQTVLNKVVSYVRLMKKVSVERRSVLFSLGDVSQSELKELIGSGINAVISKYISDSEFSNMLKLLPTTKIQLCTYFQQMYLLEQTTRLDIEEVLNHKELLILEEVNKGHNIKTIADNLNLSPNTVAAYRTKMMKKTGVKSMYQLIAKVRQQGQYA